MLQKISKVLSGHLLEEADMFHDVGANLHFPLSKSSASSETYLPITKNESVCQSVA